MVGVQLSSYKISLSWVGRLFQFNQQAVSFTESGLSFWEYRTEQTVNLTWQQLDSPPEFVWSWFGLILCVNAGGKQKQIPFLTYFASSQFEAKIKQYWAEHNSVKLDELLVRVDKACSQEYLRHSRLTLIQQRIAREYRRWYPWSKAKTDSLPQPLQKALVKLNAIHHWKEKDIEQIRERYVQSQLMKHSNFFENVESNPLTDKQRRACVIDDNNNLLLAGAGTGKTSVMVGRAGYLIKSEQACAADFLLLAYGKKAAEEMDVRIKEKLNTDSIKASTFHSLGLKIIAEVEQAKPSLSPWVNDEKAKDKWVHVRIPVNWISNSG